MAIGLKVDTDIEAKGCVVKVLHTSVGANDGELQHLLNVVGTGTVGISSLDNTDLQFLRNASAPGEIANEGSSEGSNSVTIQESEEIALVNEIVNQTVGVSVQRGAPIKRSSFRRRRSTLFCLDVVGTALKTHWLICEN